MARKKAAPKAFIVYKEWRPRPPEMALKNVYIDQECKYKLGVPPVMIDGKPFIWTNADHEFVKSVFESRPGDVRKRYTDCINDGILSDGVDESYDHSGSNW